MERLVSSLSDIEKQAASMRRADDIFALKLALLFLLLGNGALYALLRACLLYCR